MDLGVLTNYEWMILELLVVGLAARELYVVRRDIRRAREAERAKAAAEPE